MKDRNTPAPQTCGGWNGWAWVFAFRILVVLYASPLPPPSGKNLTPPPAGDTNAGFPHNWLITKGNKKLAVLNSSTTLERSPPQYCGGKLSQRSSTGVPKAGYPKEKFCVHPHPSVSSAFLSLAEKSIFQQGKTALFHIPKKCRFAELAKTKKLP